jgi:hypothetical protein
LKRLTIAIAVAIALVAACTRVSTPSGSTPGSPAAGPTTTAAAPAPTTTQTTHRTGATDLTTTTATSIKATTVGDPNCGGANGPPSTYQCNEQGYLKKLASDKIAVHDPVAVVKAGYAVCAIIGPADLPPSESGHDLVVDKQVAAVKVAGSDVVASGDVDQLVDDAIMFLC